MRITIENIASRRTAAWTKVAIPVGASMSLTEPLVFRASSGPRFAAVVGEKLGEHSQMVRIFGSYEGGQKWKGVIETGNHPQHMPFHLHLWVGDDIPALFVYPSVKIAGVIHESSAWAEVLMESSSDAHQTWALKSRIGDSGFVYRLWATFHAGDPVVDLRALIIWSDRTNPIADLKVEGLSLRAGEPIALDFRTRSGHSDPIRIGSQWHTILAGPLGFIDGSAMVAFGRMLCLPKDLTTIEIGEPWIDALMAGYEAPTVGVCQDWKNGEWLAHGNLPTWVPNIDFALDEKLRRQRFDALQDQYAGPYTRRPLGSAPNPGTTGDQEDFGSTKGAWSVIRSDPRWIHEVGYSIQADFLRGYMHYEADEAVSPVRQSFHPNWVTWSGYIDARFGDDKLGKNSPGYFERRSTGHSPYDDQHRSQNNLAAYYALTGDPCVRTLIEHQIETDLAMYPNRMGAPRAVGRLLLNWANWSRLLGSVEEGKCIRMIETKLVSVADQWEGRNANGPVKILDYNTDIRLSVTDPDTGVPLPCFSSWEHGLAAVGLYAAWKVLEPGSARNTAELTLREICNTITKFSTFVDPVTGVRQWCDNVHYPIPGQPGLPITDEQRGEPISDNYYNVNSTYVNSHPYAATSTWHVLAILIDYEFTKSPLALEIIKELDPATILQSMRQAEWWACIDASKLLEE